VFRDIVICLLLTFFLFTVAEAQQPRRVYRIGYLGSVRGGPASTEDALRSGLRELGYIEGQNLFIESRSAEGRIDRLPGLVADLIRLNVDVIVVTVRWLPKGLPKRSPSSLPSLKIPSGADLSPAWQSRAEI